MFTSFSMKCTLRCRLGEGTPPKALPFTLSLPLWALKFSTRTKGSPAVALPSGDSKNGGTWTAVWCRQASLPSTARCTDTKPGGKLCVEADPTIFSQNHLTSCNSIGSFLARKMRFHIPRPNFCNTGSDSCLWPLPSSHCINPLGSSHGWWAHVKGDEGFFGLCLTGSQSPTSVRGENVDQFCFNQTCRKVRLNTGPWDISIFILSFGFLVYFGVQDLNANFSIYTFSNRSVTSFSINLWCSTLEESRWLRKARIHVRGRWSSLLSLSKQSALRQLEPPGGIILNHIQG